MSAPLRISVTVKPNSRKESVEPEGGGSYVVRVNAPPIEGRANERVIELLAEALGIRKSAIELVAGHRGRKKVFQIRR